MPHETEAEMQRRSGVIIAQLGGLTWNDQMSLITNVMLSVILGGPEDAHRSLVQEVTANLMTYYERAKAAAVGKREH